MCCPCGHCTGTPACPSSTSSIMKVWLAWGERGFARDVITFSGHPEQSWIPFYFLSFLPPSFLTLSFLILCSFRWLRLWLNQGANCGWGLRGSPGGDYEVTYALMNAIFTVCFCELYPLLFFTGAFFSGIKHSRHLVPFTTTVDKFDSICFSRTEHYTTNHSEWLYLHHKNLILQRFWNIYGIPLI